MNTAATVSNSSFSAQGREIAREALAATGKKAKTPADVAILDDSFSSIQHSQETSECEKLLARVALSFQGQDTDEGLSMKRSILSSISAALPGAPGAVVAGAVLRAYEAAGEGIIASKLFKPAYKEIKKASFATAREKVCADITSNLSRPKGMTAAVSAYMAALTTALASGYNGPVVPLIRQVTGEQLNKSHDLDDRLRILSRGLAAINRDASSPTVDRVKAFFALAAAENILPASKSDSLAVLEAGLNEMGTIATGNAGQELAAMALKTAGFIGDHGSFCVYHGLNTLKKLAVFSPLQKEAAKIGLDVIAEQDAQNMVRQGMLSEISTMEDEDAGTGLARITLKLGEELNRSGIAGEMNSDLNNLYGTCLSRIKESKATSEVQKSLAEDGLNWSTGASIWDRTAEDTRLLMNHRKAVIETVRDTTSPEFLAREEISHAMADLQQQEAAGGSPERIVDLDDDTLFIDGLRLGKNNRFAHFALFNL